MGLKEAFLALFTPPFPSDVNGIADNWVTQLGPFMVSPKAPTKQVLTGSGTYEAPAGVLWQRVRGWGGGGGGGGAQFNSTSSAGAGGGAGGYAEVILTTPVTGIAFVCGAGGAAGPASATFPTGNGGQGGDTNFGSLLVAKGAAGGECGQNFSTFLAYPGVPTGTGTGDLVGGGEMGAYGVQISGVQIIGGQGGSSEVGTGGNQQGTDGVGDDADGFGAGGGGAMASVSGHAHIGGKGANGVIIVEEYYTLPPA